MKSVVNPEVVQKIESDIKEIEDKIVECKGKLHLLKKSRDAARDAWSIAQATYDTWKTMHPDDAPPAKGRRTGLKI